MSLQIILERIRASGDSQIREIGKNAQTQVNAILAQAQMEAHQIEEDACADASAPAIAERARILHRARLDALHIVGSVRERLVDTAIAHARERLTSFRSDPAYPVVLRSLTKEALAQFTSANGDDNIQLLADPRDRNLLREILKDLELSISVSYELNCWGGLNARSRDGRVMVINTLEARLEHATPFLHHVLSALFEEEQPETDPKGLLETFRV